MARIMSFCGANASVVTDRPFTYVIYWRSRGGPNGHSAMIIDSSRINPQNEYTLSDSFDDQDNYVSWLAGEQAAPLVHAGQASTMSRDMQSGWGGHQIGEAGGMFAGERVPTRWVALRGLDCNAMHQEWAAIRAKEGGHWKALDKNCASVVIRVLKAGCRSVGAKPSGAYGLARIWWPDLVMGYAKSLRAHVYETSSDG